jgi:DNA uptake protein ComE-like DNA-binding protein
MALLSGCMISNFNRMVRSVDPSNSKVITISPINSSRLGICATKGLSPRLFAAGRCVKKTQAWNPRRNERGFLLIAVLVIVVLASMVALSLLFRMRAEEAALAASKGSEQGWSAVYSGIQQAMTVARSAKDSTVWEKNPGLFRHQFVVDDGIDKWYYSIYCPGTAEENQARFGIVDENRKLNLNKVTAEALQKCTFLSAQQTEAIAGTNAPAAPVSMADALASEPVLLEAIRPHFSTLDELLRLPGFTPGVIYGEDANRNFHLDPNEDDGVLTFPPDDSDGQLFLGLQEVATVWSYELDLAADGSPRFQLNSTNRSVPEFIIPEKTATYIQAAWSNHVIFKTPADLLEAKLKLKNAEGKEVEIESGVGAKELPTIMDQLTTTFEARLTGLININTASVKVLQTIPGVGEGKAESVFQAREGLSAELKQSTAWLYSEGFLTADEFRRAAPFITARSHQFRFNVAGYALPSGRYRIYEVVIDTADKQPQVAYLRDITKLGLPFALPSAQDMLDVQPQS